MKRKKREDKEVKHTVKREKMRKWRGEQKVDCQRISRQNEEGARRIFTNRLKNEGKRTNSREEGG